MARFGKLPVKITSGVEVKLEDKMIVAKGPKGELSRPLLPGLTFEVKDGEAIVGVKNQTKANLSNQGTMRSHIANMIQGVSAGWSKVLELVGAGFRAEVKENRLVLTIGYSHPVIFDAGKTTKFKVEKSLITVDGIDKEEVGQLAASIRASRKPDPYRGKGIRYKDEIIRKKAGKAAAKGAAS